jgi:hypothetical protein
MPPPWLSDAKSVPQGVSEFIKDPFFCLGNDLFAQGLAQLLEQLHLLVGHAGRNGDLDDDQLIASAIPPQSGDALAS